MKLRNSTNLHVPKGQTLMRQGDSVTNFVLVKKGRIKVFARSSSGKEVVLYYIEPSQTCVLTTSCILGSDYFPAEAVAITDLKLEVISNEEFDNLLETSSEFRTDLFNNFSNRLRSLILKLEAISSGSISQRVAKLLLEKIRDLESGDNGSIVSNEVNLTHEEIANQIGSSREVVSRTLKKMEASGELVLKRGAILVTHPEKLKFYD